MVTDKETLEDFYLIFLLFYMNTFICCNFMRLRSFYDCCPSLPFLQSSSPIFWLSFNFWPLCISYTSSCASTSEGLNISLPNLLEPNGILHLRRRSLLVFSMHNLFMGLHYLFIFSKIDFVIMQKLYLSFSKISSNSKPNDMWSTLTTRWAFR